MSEQFTSLEESRLGSLSDRQVQIPACQDTVTGYSARVTGLGS